MRKQIQVLMTAILILAVTTVAMAADPHIGTWKLNLAKSKSNSGPQAKNATATFTAIDNGIKLVGDSVDAEGKAAHQEFEAKYDGKDYPFKATGSTEAETIALKRVDDHTWAEVSKRSAKVTSGGQNTVSADGKTMTRTYTEKNAKGKAVTNIDIYDKQ
jgi:hypothetical protein